MSVSFMQRRTSQKFYRSTEELLKPEEAKLLGSIPQWLTGTFLRTGPGLFDLGDNFTLNHWLDGYAIISKFHVSGQSVKFEKKFLQSESFKRAKKANKPCICEYGTRAYSDPTRSWMSRLYNTLVSTFYIFTIHIFLGKKARESLVVGNTWFLLQKRNMEFESCCGHLFAPIPTNIFVWRKFVIVLICIVFDV